MEMDSEITGVKDRDRAESQAIGSEEVGTAANDRETPVGGRG